MSAAPLSLAAPPPMTAARVRRARSLELPGALGSPNWPALFSTRDPVMPALADRVLHIANGQLTT
jgi:hypothetical protein